MTQHSQPMTVQQAFELAIGHHQAGRFVQAETICRQILSSQPNHADALHLLGAVAFQVGQLEVARQLISRAITFNPTASEYHGNLGKVLAAQGRHGEAIAAFRKSLELDPASADILNSLASSLESTDQLDEAISRYQHAITLQPDLADAHNNLGVALGRKGQIDQAIASFETSMSLHPGNANTLYNLGMTLHEKGQIERAIDAFERAVSLKPKFANAHLQLGIALHRAGRPEEATAAFERAIAARPDMADAHSNLGASLTAMGRFEEGAAAFERTIGIDPGHASAHFNLGMSLLTRGDFSRGWKEFEWRWEMEEDRAWRDSFTKPRWTGGDLNGQRILLYAEQGLGDTIMFARYLPLIVSRGGRVILQCQEELERLLRTVPGIAQLVIRGQTLPEYDVHCPLMSAPFALNTTGENIPREIPYLRCDPELSSRWRERVSRDSAMVGIAWSGRATHTNDRRRSMPLETLRPLFAVPGVSFFSLQKDPSTPPDQPSLLDWTSEFHDFADTAGLIDNLDLVITVDTAVAHLAGAMGKPVWLLIPFVPDWRWMLGRDDSPWYPTMRLFRQPRRADWDAVVSEVVRALQSHKIERR